MNLKKYLDDRGIRINWFAKKIGIGQHYLSDHLRARVYMPPKYWSVIIEATKSKINAKALLEDYNEVRASRNEKKQQSLHRDNSQLSQDEKNEL